jgi:hypothetical protein
MHIHSNTLSTPTMAPTQSAQRVIAEGKAALEVRRKLTGFAASEEDETVSRAEAYAESDPNRKQEPQQEEAAFRSVFFYASA